MLSGHKFLALSGFSLIAAAYGLARFSWGLQLPAVIRDIPMSSTLVGALSAASFAAYGVASVIASLCSAYRAPFTVTAGWRLCHCRLSDPRQGVRPVLAAGWRYLWRCQFRPGVAADG
ncbi:hypothetical protein QMS78_05155 [Cronobacter dublinensis]|uniref:YbfB/YjiJ family MFS transporter n=1 Tax=Cronobacter dublinensis TaxID=413497 RepID=UPI0024C34072|nr:hypothetical protein [Cronobacter dublinensis]MDK1251885.1 hypothetical protein [Cronobacter dublinensis]